jgi:hypothetical protein
MEGKLVGIFFFMVFAVIPMVGCLVALIVYYMRKKKRDASTQS